MEHIKRDEALHSDERSSHVCTIALCASYLLVTNRMTVQSLENISGRIRILKTVKI